MSCSGSAFSSPDTTSDQAQEEQYHSEMFPFTREPSLRSLGIGLVYAFSPFEQRTLREAPTISYAERWDSPRGSYPQQCLPFEQRPDSINGTRFALSELGEDSYPSLSGMAWIANFRWPYLACASPHRTSSCHEAHASIKTFLFACTHNAEDLRSPQRSSISTRARQDVERCCG
jgi:hypothetical protein